MLSSVSDVNARAEIFQETFEVILNVHAPLGKPKVRSELAPSLSSSIRQRMIKRDRTKKDAKEDPSLLSSCMQLYNKVTAKIHLSIQEFYPGLIEQHKEILKTYGKQ